MILTLLAKTLFFLFSGFLFPFLQNMPYFILEYVVCCPENMDSRQNLSWIASFVPYLKTIN